MNALIGAAVAGGATTGRLMGGLGVAVAGLLPQLILIEFGHLILPFLRATKQSSE